MARYQIGAIIARVHSTHEATTRACMRAPRSVNDAVGVRCFVSVLVLMDERLDPSSRKTRKPFGAFDARPVTGAIINVTE